MLDVTTHYLTLTPSTTLISSLRQKSLAGRICKKKKEKIKKAALCISLSPHIYVTHCKKQKKKKYRDFLEVTFAVLSVRCIAMGEALSCCSGVSCLVLTMLQDGECQTGGVRDPLKMSLLSIHLCLSVCLSVILFVHSKLFSSVFLVLCFCFLFKFRCFLQLFVIVMVDLLVTCLVFCLILYI